MVTNLTQETKAKWAEAIAARDPETKLRLLREFYSVMPKCNVSNTLKALARLCGYLKSDGTVRAKSRSERIGNSVKFYADNKEKFMQDLLKSFEVARVFTKKVGKDFQLKDFDVVELHVD